MKKTRGKGAFSFLITFLVCTLCTGAVIYLVDGVPLYGLPDAEDIVLVRLTDLQHPDKTVELERKEDIQNARNVANVLRFRLGQAEDRAMAYQIDYHLQNGKTVTLTAGEGAVAWGGAIYPVKKDGKLFVNVVEGLFFYQGEK